MTLRDRTGEAAPAVHLVRDENAAALDRLGGALRGRVALAYLDPPYATGSTFHTRVLVGEDPAPHPLADGRHATAVAYRDLWGGDRDRYLAAMRDRIARVHGLLAPDGALVLHADVAIGPYLKCLLDEVFGGGAHFRSAIAWHYYNKLGDRRKRALPSAFDTLYWYVRDPDAGFAFHALEEPRDRPVRQLVRRKVGGRAVNARDAEGRLVYRESTTRRVDNVWRIPALTPSARHEWAHFETQKPVALLERVVAMFSRPGDLVLDPFLGSGTSAVAAARLGRRAVGVDASPLAVHLARKRLLADADRRGAAVPPLLVEEPGRAAPAPTAEATHDGDRVRLVGARSPALTGALADEPPTRWTDAVDYWAVGVVDGDGGFVEAARSFRTRQRRALETALPAPPGVPRGDLRVRVVDPLGAASELVTPRRSQ